MNLIYPINFVGHDEWLESGYMLNLAGGDVVSRDGEVLGKWRVVEYDPDDAESGGRYEFVMDGQDSAELEEKFAFLDYGVSRGLALSNLTRMVEELNRTKHA